ncbi:MULTISPECIES: aminomethyl-transferring glycine dehydrogenase subunit GcvPA [Bacillus]|jgi:glycine dehydrogenase subunit 1|uniref:Probable glycine dehydrogenase (decarboxylating) subunit 1 n=1 Tax=Bacillus amyloliquefaciens (strain ATCC 23350 / DSM 7 / BCRC 11601 / CCUG 28519 / NBRC 15535 / NRRL B-14393 / F) TaxID=692420 RepID=A0A9P1JI90_BACAS|nr:aminomethyl-transferring glycine dehydrogenase subunit GcvPA [Bacillus amyloliquefaciens]AIW34405.1 glycine dehydrogenase [Bacillus subtilis]AEB24688.1 glycine dehydrogenase subunit 1 [Bacillus amyloliquefaciens TA208]AEB64185.1 glycine decarboxylase (subunit 1) (glycine cleavage system protein P) [Bacillus amyloliquefaciens LL3]AEK89703.1 glycine dehydrogenase subunit 1 [Bacillus amyloliquefaciens XH7]ARW39626.1 Glycine dehydrogenase (aminomethyl-transferring) [Bacillus amyloliquefaciens]
MKHRYLPATEQDKKEMLKAIGAETIDELFADIPEDVRFQKDYQIKKAKSETELTRELTKLAAKNKDAVTYASFLGAGVYDHYQPVIVDHVISRSEFYTAYTPYQPEISQGELQAIFEFQTMICELTGMDIANSSMYDGGTALAEAAMLASGHTKKKKIVISAAVHPESRDVLKTYAKGQYIEVVEVPAKNGVTDLEALEDAVCDETAAVIVQYPNFFGQIEPLKDIEPLAHKGNSQLIVSSNPLALGILTPPGAYGADIVVGDAQPFGIPAAFGGPHCGYFAVTKKLMRKVPGRLVGQTEDENGRRGFVLTLQAREQHIRRDKATSNICSNQALNALAASVAMTALGKNGVKDIARQNILKADYARRQAEKAGLHIAFDGPMFNEFAVRLNEPVKEANRRLLQQGIIGGYDLGLAYPELKQHMLIAVTELRTKEEIDSLIAGLGDQHE